LLESKVTGVQTCALPISNTCDQCYVSIRSYLDKSFPRLLWENVSGFFSFKPRTAG
jgi:hypothetical protein